MATVVPKVRLGETGPEKFCTQCDEWWPADGEFFYTDPKGAAGPFYMCKACYVDRRYHERRPHASRIAAGEIMIDKVAYVKSQGQTRRHHCHWPGCDKQVPPAMWGCRAHWYALPDAIRNRIWATFRPGQEASGTPSRAYVEAARAAQQWIAEHQELGAVQSFGKEEVDKVKQFIASQQDMFRK